jgi:guanylate kinase
MVGKLFLLSGPSGVGKGTILTMLKARHPEFIYPLSVTTRSPRPDEKNGQTYYFVTNQQFDHYIQQGALLEWATVHQYDRYGILKAPIMEALQNNKTIIREVDVQGWKTIMQSEIHSDVISIFILPPSLEVLKQRILKRAPISPQELDTRLQDMTMEMEYAKDYTYRVISEENQQERVYQEIEHIILSEIQK